MEIGKVVRDIPPPPVCLSKPLCAYMRTIITQIISELHAEARGAGGGGRKSIAEKRKRWVGNLHPLY